MNFGISIDNNFLRTLTEYRGKTDLQLTAKDRSKVALLQQDVYAPEAIKRLDQLKGDYGNGASTLCRFYNASGGQIKVQLEESWRGSFYKDLPLWTVENGQWTTFLHVHPWGSASGSTGAVIYRTVTDTDIFIGWQNPCFYSWFSDPKCWAESFEKDHWWGVGTKGHMLDLLDGDAGKRKEHAGSGYKVNVQIGNSTTCSCIAVIEKTD